MIWDATLVESLTPVDNIKNSATPSAKIFRIQMIIDTSGDIYHTFIRETSLHREHIITCKGDGHFSRAIAEFNAAFKRLTGLIWSEHQEQPKSGKAIFIQSVTYDDQPKLESAVCDVLSNFVNIHDLLNIKTTLLEPYPNKLLETKAKTFEHSILTAISLLNKISDLQRRTQDDSGGAKRLTTSLSQCFFGLFWPKGTPLPTKVKTDWISRSRRSIKDLGDFKGIEDAPKKSRKLSPTLSRHVLGLLHLEGMTTGTSLSLQSGFKLGIGTKILVNSKR